MTTNRKRYPHQQGSVAVEYLISVPVLVMLFMATVELSRLFINLISVSQVAYSVASVGSILPLQRRSEAMETIGVGLVLLQNRDLMRNAAGEKLVEARYDAASNTNEVKIRAQLRLLTKFLPLNIRLDVAGPVLVSDHSLGDRTQFILPPEFYGCDGQVIAGCSNEACAPPSC